jgi:transcriptional pleiotropic regulator of transition state genes
MGKFKKINRAGGLTIPAELRRNWDFTQGDAIEIVPQGGNLVIKKYTPKCFLCSSTNEVKRFKGKDICKECIKELAKEVGLVE